MSLSSDTFFFGYWNFGGWIKLLGLDPDEGKAKKFPAEPILLPFELEGLIELFVSDGLLSSGPVIMIVGFWLERGGNGGRWLAVVLVVVVLTLEILIGVVLVLLSLTILASTVSRQIGFESISKVGSCT